MEFDVYVQGQLYKPNVEANNSMELVWQVTKEAEQGKIPHYNKHIPARIEVVALGPIQ